MVDPYPNLDQHDPASAVAILIGDPHAYLLSVAAWLGEAGLAIPDYHTEAHRPTDHFLRIPVEHAAVDLGWNSADGWFYLVHIGGGPASMAGEVAVDPAGEPEDVVAAVLPVLDEVRAAVTR
jgi:hypothetical protein